VGGVEGRREGGKGGTGRVNRSSPGNEQWGCGWRGGWPIKNRRRMVGEKFL